MDTIEDRSHPSLQQQAMEFMALFWDNNGNAPEHDDSDFRHWMNVGMKCRCELGEPKNEPTN